ncbi:hypothetical protein N0V93_001473 [Gnomoniopsis smithogilvyi]|uniref:N-acetyltransferase domain-containing protein n=1 Tax=Gnomoniopsis smithogilvyi TaxID=1191159 RepID=A0A9W9D289_9PEZI|nr:hypothetical protein N0V93_001473 [Gnomoniopsis smithogilvyi]
MPEDSTPIANDIKVALVEDADDFLGMSNCAAKAFGDQTHDAIWIGLNPGWDTAEGRAAAAARMAKRWQSVTKDKDGRPNTIFLKATVPDPKQPGKRLIAGMASWSQHSFVLGCGTEPSNKLEISKDVPAMDFKSEDDELFATQLWAGLMSKRVEVIKEKADTESPVAFTLDVCAVDPDFQRRGIAAKLVQYGLDEAERRGGLEAMTEASVMGRHVYKKLGFQPVAEIDYGVDEKLIKGRNLPSNLFMRTRP